MNIIKINNFKKMNYVFYDFETCGSNKDFDQILQIGAVLTDESFTVKD